MEKYLQLRKGLSVGIILLFIGVAITPSINVNVVKASNDNDPVEITSEACGIKGFGNTTVKLNKQQYQNLGQYLVDFRERLNQTTTREEAVPIFKEAVVELNKYGLLPKRMSVEQAQKLVVGGFETKTNKLFEKLLQKNHKSSTDYSNYCCLIYGRTTKVLPIGFLLKILSNFCLWRNHDNLYEIISFAMLLNALLVPFGDLPWLLSPISILNVLNFGIYDFISGYHGYDYFPSEGYIYSLGLLGFKQYNGSFYGALPLRPLVLFWFNIYFLYTSTVYFPGVFGFTGFKIDSGSRTIFLGSALWINISSEPPMNNRIMG